MKRLLVVVIAVVSSGVASASAPPPRNGPSSITERGSSFSFIVGAKIPDIEPTLGSAVTQVSISPDIKATGLSFNKQTGKISGVPTAAAAGVYTLTTITGTPRNPGQSSSTQIYVELHDLHVATAPAASTASGCEFTLEIGDFQSTNPNVTVARVFAGGDELYAGGDGLYHVPLTDPSYTPIVDTNDRSQVPYGVFEVHRFLGSIIAGNRGHQDDDGSKGYVYYNAAATLNCAVSSVKNVRGADGFEKEADGVAFIGHAGNDQFTVAGNQILFESSTTGAADTVTIAFSFAAPAPPPGVPPPPPGGGASPPPSPGVPATPPPGDSAAAPAASPAAAAPAADAAQAQAAADAVAEAARVLAEQQAAAQAAADAAAAREAAEAQAAAEAADLAAAAAAACAAAAVDAQAAADAAAAAAAATP